MLPLLRRRANGVGGVTVSSKEMGRELQEFTRHLRMAPERKIFACDFRPPGRILTDAELDVDNGTAGIGAILLDDNGRPDQYFSETVPKWVLDAVQRASGSQHVISALDLMAAFIALKTWGTRCDTGDCFLPLTTNLRYVQWSNLGRPLHAYGPYAE